MAVELRKETQARGVMENQSLEKAGLLLSPPQP